ncbi:MAG: biotin/lipoyl-binding protein [bacterium]|nr:biotin/lipoyl-binding protein [bacterium]
MAIEFKLPPLGENVETATITSVLVSIGDAVSIDQPVIEVETDKAAAEVPSSVSGTVTEILVDEGETVKVGQVILRADESAQPAAPEQKPEAKPEPEPEPEPVPVKAASEPVPVAAPVAAKAAPAKTAKPRPDGPVPASPSVRRLAREIGVDIHEVPATGEGGRISAEDVKNFARALNAEAPSAQPSAASPQSPSSQPAPAPLGEPSRWGEIQRKEMNSVRRRTAQHMTQCWTTIPHVTQFDKADVTDVDALRKKHGKEVEAQGGKLTMTAILVKATASALKKFPQFNASVDVENNEIVYKKYYNIGVAVDTDRGLLVPVIHDADAKSITDIAVELGAIAERARTRKITIEEMQGGTFTISNLGGIGGTAFTPIVNAPEVAILGVSRARVEPVWVDGSFVPRTLLPLSLSYDHRVIDGADGARFLRWVCEALEEPFVMSLEA